MDDSPNLPILHSRGFAFGEPRGHLETFFLRLHLLFHLFDLNPLLAYIEAKPSVQAHVLVGDPHQGKAANQVASPVIEKKFVAGDKKKKDRYIVAEAIFTEAWKVVCARAACGAVGNRAVKRVGTQNRVIEKILSKIDSRGSLGLPDKIRSLCCWLCG